MLARVFVPDRPFHDSLRAKQEPTLLIHLSGAPLCGRFLALATNIRLARNKRSSLLQTMVNYRRKKFYNIGPWHNELVCLTLKTITIVQTLQELRKAEYF